MSKKERSEFKFGQEHWIPKDEPYHMTQLVDDMIKKGKQVGMYPISENSFLDMGEFVEMNRMEELINAIFAE